jgi:hypothetical protein
VVQLKGNLTVRSRLDDVLGCTNGLGGGNKALYTSKNTLHSHLNQCWAVPRQDRITAHHSERWNASAWGTSIRLQGHCRAMGLGDACTLCHENGASHPLPSHAHLQRCAAIYEVLNGELETDTSISILTWSYRFSKQRKSLSPCYVILPEDDDHRGFAITSGNTHARHTP